MMRILKVLVMTLAIVIALAGLVSVFMPETASTERQITLAVPAAELFESTNDLRKFQAWSPWSSIDPNARHEYTGPESGLGMGAVTFTGEHDVKLGDIEIIESVANQRVKMQLSFVRGFPAQSTLQFTDNGDTTTVTWRLEAYMETPINKYLGIGYDQWQGRALERGLAQLAAHHKTQ